MVVSKLVGSMRAVVSDNQYRIVVVATHGGHGPSYLVSA